MRQILLGLLTAALTFREPSAIQLANAAVTLSGRVVIDSGADVRPVRRAKVTLSAGSGPARVTDTDVKGTYRFDRLPAGDYTVTVEKPGFVTLKAPASPDATLTLERAGAIEGTISDAAGDPIWNVEVSLLRLGSERQPKPLARTRTDDLGRYRFHSLPAGEYYVDTLTDETFFVGGERRLEPIRTFYPTGSTLDEAKPVPVSLGRDTTGVDLTLAMSAPQGLPASGTPAPVSPSPRASPVDRAARVEGRVLDAASGRPIRNARVTLIAERAGGLFTRTDGLGRFSFASRPARRYTLTAEADRFVSLEFGQRQPGEPGMDIELRDGEDFAAEIRLPRAGAIEGVIVDEFGDPVPNVPVRLARRAYAAGRQRLLPAGNRVAPGAQRSFVTVRPGAMMLLWDDVQAPVTDDRGRYRVPALPPGDYVVEALSGAYAGTNDVGGFAPTYYPGTSDATLAAPVTVAVGADTAASFALVPARTFSVSGLMVDPEGRPVADASLWLTTPDSLRRPDFNLARATTALDGRFRLRNVPQGAYTLQGVGPASSADIWANPQGKFFGWLGLTVGDSNVDDVVIRITGGTTLRGKVVLEDASVSPPTPDEVRVTAIPVEFDSAPLVGEPPPSMTRTGSGFEVSRLFGVRRILVTVSSPVWSLKQIGLNGIDITDAPVDFRARDVDGVEVVLSPKVSRVSGRVSGDKGPISGYAVVIFASDPTKWIDRSRFVVLTRSTQQGWFDVRGLPPEDYLAIALPNVGGNEWQDPEFLQQIRGQATAFVLTEGESRTLELKLKTRP